MSYIFYSDPSHGWLKVSRAELVFLGLKNEISSHSYISNGYVYLDEDRDLPLFIEAKEAKYGISVEIDIKEVYEDPTPIRNYESYK